MTTLDIIRLLMEVKQGFTVEELYQFTRIEKKEIIDFLQFLERKAIVKKENENYFLTRDYYIGKILYLPRKGWMVTDKNQDYKVEITNEFYKSGDFVLFEKKQKETVEIVFHFPKDDVRIGEIKRNGNLTYIVGKNDSLIPLIGETSSLVDGSIVSYYKDNDHAMLIQLLCHRDDPNFMIQKVVKELKIPDTFSKETLQETENIPNTVLEKDLLGCRDLRDKEIFTIDGDFSKDFDDAVSLERLPNGNYLLGVHIAHVSHYVKEGMAMDLDARIRGLSVYLIQQVIPMLPHKLSNGICSLNPNVDRLTRTCEMEIDPNGDVVHYEIFPSVIRSKKRMTYREVNQVLKDIDYPKSYEPFKNTLKEMHTLATLLRKKAERNGFVDFEQSEMGFSVTDQYEVLNVYPMIRGEAEKLIEMFMIEANKTVALEMSVHAQPILYRIHPGPDLKNMNDALLTLGLPPLEEYSVISTKDVQNILKQVKNHPAYPILAHTILLAFKKARYNPINSGHFGIAATHYTHFTSPIRRYPDLLLHRRLDSYDYKKDYQEEASKEKAYLELLGNYFCSCERRADLAESFVNEEFSAIYLKKYIGEKMQGRVCTISSKGIHIQLPNLIEGGVKDLGQFKFIKNGEAFVEAKGFRKTLRLGDLVEVYLIEANPYKREINFSFVKPKILKKN